MGKKENQKAFFNDKVWESNTIFNWLYGVVSIGSVIGFFLLDVDEVLEYFFILILSDLFVLNSLMRWLYFKENKKIDFLVYLFNLAVKYFNSLMRWLHSKRLKQENKETKRVKQENKEIDFLVYFVNLVVEFFNLLMILISSLLLLIYILSIFFPNSEDTIVSFMTFILPISIDGLAILFTVELFKEFFEKLLKITWFQGLLLLSSIVIIDWLKAEDIAFFVAILLSLSMSAQTYQNIASFLDKAKITKSDSKLRAFFNRPSDLDDDEQWDGKIQLQKIGFSLFLIGIYIVFKATESYPLNIYGNFLYYATQAIYYVLNFLTNSSKVPTFDAFNYISPALDRIILLFLLFIARDWLIKKYPLVSLLFGRGNAHKQVLEENTDAKD